MGSVFLFKPAPRISNRFLYYYLISNIGNSRLKRTSGATAQQAIYIAHLKRDYVMPLCSRAEQDRIVARVENLLSICDTLEAKLRQSEQDAERLMESVVEKLLNGGAKN